jgi:hypothetical protein
MAVMRIRTQLILALAAFLPFQVSHAADVLPPYADSAPLDVVFVDFQIREIDETIEDSQCPSFPPYPDAVDNRKIHIISFDQSGSIFWNGEKVTNDSLDKKLKSDLVTDGLTELHIRPNEHAPAGVAIVAFKRIIATEFPCYGFVGNENYRKIWRAKKLIDQPWALTSIRFSTAPHRERIVPPIVVQILSTDDGGRSLNDPEFSGVSSTGRCRAFLGEKPVSDDELVRLSTKAMMDAIEAAGGEKKLMTGEIGAETMPNTIILTTPNTPWRCVGGAVHNLQLSGFLSIGFALMPESQ